MNRIKEYFVWNDVLSVTIKMDRKYNDGCETWYTVTIRPNKEDRISGTARTIEEAFDQARERWEKTF